MKEKGVIKQILEKHKGGLQICPDMSGQPIGINNSFTAFLLLLGENLCLFIDLRRLSIFIHFRYFQRSYSNYSIFNAAKLIMSNYSIGARNLFSK